MDQRKSRNVSENIEKKDYIETSIKIGNVGFMLTNKDAVVFIMYCLMTFVTDFTRVFFGIEEYFFFTMVRYLFLINTLVGFILLNFLFICVDSGLLPENLKTKFVTVTKKIPEEDAKTNDPKSC